MKSLTYFVLLCLNFLFFSIATSQIPPTEIPLWEVEIPGKNCVEGDEIIEDRNPEMQDRSVRNIKNPTLTVYLPGKSSEEISAVIICPGGGYHLLALDKEGHDLARWFNDIGMAAFVLKYRMPCPSQGNYTPLPLLDAQRAIRLVRLNAEKWNLDPDKIGIMGFSAGGHLTTSAGTHFDSGIKNAADQIDRVSCRPDFLIAIYPVVSLTKDYSHTGSRRNLLGENPGAEWLIKYSNELQVTKETPPAFLIHTEDDRVSARNSIDFYLALMKAGVPAEMHLFAEGGHGYGLRKIGKPVEKWPKLCEEWLRNMGFIQ